MGRGEPVNERPSWRSTLHAWLYLFPAFLIIAVFCIYPIIRAFDISLYTEYDFYKNVVYERGFDNFVYVLKDPEFSFALKNTCIVVAGVVPLSIVISLGLAYGLHTRTHLHRFIQTAYFLPVVASVIAVSMTWRWMFHTEYGLLNSIMGWIGIEPIGWLTTPEWALPSVIMFSVWRSLGFNMILFWVGLQSIHPQYDRSARVDGATSWRRFTHVTLPLLAPTLIYVSVVSMLHAFKTFDEVYALFGGKAGPMDSAMTVLYYVFRKYYGESEFGIASAGAYVLFLITFGAAWIHLRIIYKKIPGTS